MKIEINDEIIKNVDAKILGKFRKKAVNEDLKLGKAFNQAMKFWIDKKRKYY